MGKGGRGGVERALEVHVDHRLEVVGVELEERPVGAHSRVRDGDVEPAEALHHLLGGPPDRVPFADIAVDPERALEAEVLATAGEQADRGSGRVQGARHRGADAAAGAGHEGDLAVELSHRGRPARGVRSATESTMREGLYE